VRPVRRYLSRVTTGLMVLLAMHAVVVPLVLRYALAIPREETIVGQVDLLRRREQRDDSWRPMQAARTYIAAHPGGDVYEAIFFSGHVKFQYPPTSLLAIDGLSRRALNAVSWCAVWMTVVLATLSFRTALLRMRRDDLRPTSPLDIVVALGCAGALSVTFYPLLKGYTLGQIQVWVDALVAAALWAWCTERRLFAGVAFGLVCLIKPPLAIVALWSLARRDWRMLTGLLTAGVLGLAVSIASYGIASHVSYGRVLTFIAQRGEAYYPNQSFNGLLNRWLANGDNLEFQDFEFSPPNRLVSAGTAAAGILLLAAALIVPALRRPVDDRIDLAIVIVTATIVSPIAWEHHYGVLPPVLAMLAPAVLDRTRAPRRTAVWLAASFLTTGQYFAPVQRLASTRFNPLQSYVLFGALLLLAIAYAAILRPHGASHGSPRREAAA
jgi:alpha-1,2-mannosyltransferase